MSQNRYSQIIERIFFQYYEAGADEIIFRREDIARAAAALSIELPKNLGDVIYSFRYRASLPDAIRAQAPEGKVWIIRPSGRAMYRFVAVPEQPIIPNILLAQTKIPDATPGIVTQYAFNDEQALLAKLRYNRLIDIFTGATCYSLQNHLRTTVPEVGQVETDEIYVGLDRRGVHYVFPVQAKGGSDKLSIIQIEQDFAVCAQKFPGLICRAIAAQFMADDGIALFGFEMNEHGVAMLDEKQYRLVVPEMLTADDLSLYQQRLRSDII
jgi:hypothetical protein